MEHIRHDGILAFNGQGRDQFLESKINKKKNFDSELSLATHVRQGVDQIFVSKGEQMKGKHLQYSDRGYGCCFPVCGNGRLVPGSGILNKEDFIKAIADGTACPLCEQLHNQFEKLKEKEKQ
jgi:hypothetical protein